MPSRASGDKPAAAVVASKRKHRRRPSTPEETARRKAWGKQWGGMISMYWQAKRAQAKG